MPAAEATDAPTSGVVSPEAAVLAALRTHIADHAQRIDPVEDDTTYTSHEVEYRIDGGDWKALVHTLDVSFPTHELAVAHANLFKAWVVAFTADRQGSKWNKPIQYRVVATEWTSHSTYL